MEAWEERLVPRQSPPLQVLVAVDNPTLRDRLFRLLDGRGDDVAIASNRHELETLVRTLHFDLALADLKLSQSGLGMRTLVLVDKALSPDTPFPSSLTIPFADQDLFRVLDALTQDVVPLPSSELPFSPETALDYLDGDQELLREMLGYCLAEAPLRLVELRNLITQENLPGVEFLAHNLKGLVGGIGAKASWRASSSLEQAAKAGSLEEVCESLPLLECEIERLAKALQEHLEALPIPLR